MGVNRGNNCDEPCPICHVPISKLHDCGRAQWALQTGPETQGIIDKARKLKATESEALLKKNGLRPIDVCSNLYFISLLSTHYDRMPL